MKLKFSFLVILILFISLSSAMSSENYDTNSIIEYTGKANSSNFSSTNTIEKISGETTSSNYSYSASFLESDTTNPQVSINSPTAGTTYAISSINFIITTNENSTCEYSVDSGATNNSMTANASGTRHTATESLSNGAYTANFYCSDINGNANNTQSVSFSVSVSSGDTGTGSSGGGGGGGGETTPPKDIETSVDSFDKVVALNRIEEESISIKNTADYAKQAIINLIGLEGIVIFDKTSYTIEPGETTDINFRITPPKETGLYTGTIKISIGGQTKEIPVSINVKTEKSLFDIILTIPEQQRNVREGTNLETQIDMIQMGIREKMDVTLNYVIKDYSNQIYLSESETIAVETQKKYPREFYTKELPPGNYVLGIELIYPDGVAVTSSQFKIETHSQSIKRLIEQILIIAGIAGVITLTIVTIKRYKKLSKLKKK